MKAISLLQPWATLVVIGIKTIETRSWNKTPWTNPDTCQPGKAGSIFTSELPFKKYIPDFKKLPFGAIIGQGTITDVIRVEDLGNE